MDTQDEQMYRKLSNLKTRTVETMLLETEKILQKKKKILYLIGVTRISN